MQVTLERNGTEIWQGELRELVSQANDLDERKLLTFAAKQIPQIPNFRVMGLAHFTVRREDQ